MNMTKIQTCVGHMTYLSHGVQILPHQIVALAAKYGLHEPSLEELRYGRDTAAALIDPGIASTEAFLAAKAKSGVCAFVFTEEGKVTGMIGMLLLTESGLEAVMDGSFDARSPADPHLCVEGEDVFGGYAWGVTATTKEGARAALTCATGLYDGLFWPVPVFARIATEDGRRVLTGSLQYSQVPWNDEGLVWRKPEGFGNTR